MFYFIISCPIPFLFWSIFNYQADKNIHVKNLLIITPNMNLIKSSCYMWFPKTNSIQIINQDFTVNKNEGIKYKAENIFSYTWKLPYFGTYIPPSNSALHTELWLCKVPGASSQRNRGSYWKVTTLGITGLWKNLSCMQLLKCSNF